MMTNTAKWLALGWILSLAILPFFISDEYFIHILILSMIMGILASSWNLLIGEAGIFSFGHQAFFGVGAYVSAVLAIQVNVSPWITMLFGGIAAALASLVIAVPCLRLRGAPYISIATLAFAEICRLIATNMVEITRGELGLWGIPGLFASKTRIPYYYAALALLLLVLSALAHIKLSPLGLAFRAIRESPEAAEAVGINTDKTRILAFVVSSLMAGFVGAFYAHYLGILTPSSVLSIRVMIEIVTLTLLGGLGSLFGPMLAAFIITIGLEYMRWLGDYRLIMYGIGLILLIVFMPHGIVPQIRTLAQQHYSRRKGSK